MGTVLRKTVTRPLPRDAVVTSRRRRATARELRQEPGRQTIVEQVATWRDRTGKKRTAVAVSTDDGSIRIRVESETYYAKYRDGEGIVRVIPTGCRDKQAAQNKLAELERTADKVRAGAITPAELHIAGHNRTPTVKHIADYIEYLRQKGTHCDRVKTTESRLTELITECGFNSLRDLNADALLGWLSTASAAGRSASVLNGYIECAVAFGYWLAGKRTTKRRANQLGDKRLSLNPFAGIGKYDQRADRRRERRAMSETELRRLIYVARWRPLAELGRETERLPAEELPASTKSRRTWKAKPLAFESLQEAVAAAKAKLADKPERIAALERLGRERALIYKLAVLTGCRRGEIESLTVGHLDLDAGVLRLRPQDTKNGDAADLALRGDLVEDLRAWLETLQPEATGSVVSMRQASRLRPETPLFEVCRQFVKTLNRDLAVAGIAKRDDRGRTVDFHALRTTFGTLLSVNGVAPRTAQQAMRHSEIGLTMNVYTDPKLLDLVGAVEALPHLRLDDMPTAECERLLHSTGTDGALSRVQRTVAPTVAPTAALTCHFEAKTGSLGNVQRAVENRPELHKTKGNAGFLSVGVTGFEPAASASRTKTTSVGIADSERVYNESIRALHQLLHQGGSLTHAVEPIERLAELLRDALTSEQRERLAVLLGDSQRRT